jgi:hypothetical protein
MDPRGSARFCGKCDKLVHDLSALGERAARELMEQTPESLCVRYLHDATGQIWFGSERELVPTAALSRKKRSLTAAALVAVTPVLFQACGGADPYGPYRFGDDAGVDQEDQDAGMPPNVPIDATSGEGGTSADADPDAGSAGSR